MKNQTLFLIAFIALLSFPALDAQNSYIKNRWNIKAGYAAYPGMYVPDNGGKLKGHYGNYQLEANYGLFNFLETGLYLGYSRLTTMPVPVAGDGLTYANQNTPFFGLNLNFHPLTFLIKKPDFRFDLYLLARYGGVYYSSPQDYVPAKGLLFQYQHGAGLGIYLSKHIGVFGEYTYGILTKPSGCLRFGLDVKF